VDQVTPSTIYTGRFSMWRSTNAGGNWVEVSGLGPCPVPDPQASGTLYTCDGLRMSVDSGTSIIELNPSVPHPIWTGESPPIRLRGLAIDPKDSQVRYAGAHQPIGVYRSLDGGSSYHLADSGIESVSVSSIVIDPVDTSVLYAGTSDSDYWPTASGSGVFRSENGGDTWAPLNEGLAGLVVTALALDSSGASDLVRLYAGVADSPWGEVAGHSIYKLEIERRAGISARVKPGVYRNGRWLLDTNGNGTFEPGMDFDFILGWPGATPVTGDWNGDGRKKTGVFAAGFWFLDYDGDGVFNPESSGGPDKQFPFGWDGVTPVVGDWNGDGRDSVGVHANGFWFIDYDGDRLWHPESSGGPDKIFGFGGWPGVELVLGDWNGDGRTKLGLYSQGFWFLDYDGNYAWDGGVADKVFGFGWTGAKPMVGDWNGDGRDSVAVYSGGFWFFDYDGDTQWNPAPGGQDRIFGLGWTGAIPVVGDWNGDGRVSAGVFSAGTWFLDFDASGAWNPLIAKAISWGELGDTPFAGRW
jgi:hypothetical protein